ncbi:MAG TPA: ATP-binding protein [Pseudomonadales bacterium]
MADVNLDNLRMIADAIPHPVGYILPDGTLGFANRALLRANRLPPDARGKSVTELLTAEENQAGKESFETCLRENRRVLREGPAYVPDGPPRWARYVYQPVRDADGNILGVCVTVVDLTDIKNAEEALKASHAELERSNRDLEQFAYVASHDLKAPLRSIEVLVGWLADDLADYKEGDVQENLELLRSRTARLNRLLDDLLAYSRVGRRVGEVVAVDTRELVQDIWSMLAPPEGMQLVLGELPTFTTFRAPLEQVLRNLMGNAVKHHPGPAGRITVSAERTGEHWRFAVADNGAGIPEEYRERIYQMFQTLQPRDEVEGSGMGLAIVSRVVEWQGGRVWHEPVEQGTGTVFKFEWKIVDAAGAQRLLEAKQAKERAA